MSVGAKEQVGRLLALVPLIRRRGEMRVDEAAATLGIEPEQLIVDLRVLIYCGWPGWMPGDLIEVDLDVLDGEGLIRISNADYLGAPLRLSSAEASAIIVALRTLRDSAEPDTVDSLDRALAKLEAAVEEGTTGHVDVQMPTVQRETTSLRAELGGAIQSGRQVALTYYVPARDENTERVVDPLGLVDTHGMTYLDAWCHLANSRRLFRIDRIIAAELLDTPSVPHPDAEPLDLADGLFQPSESSELVTLRLAPEARWVAEYYPIAAAREGADNHLDIDLYAADSRWLMRLLLRLAPHTEVIAPPELAVAYAAAARGALSLYGDRA